EACSRAGPTMMRLHHQYQRTAARSVTPRSERGEHQDGRGEQSERRPGTPAEVGGAVERVDEGDQASGHGGRAGDVEAFAPRRSRASTARKIAATAMRMTANQGGRRVARAQPRTRS